MVFNQEFWGARYQSKNIGWQLADVHPKLLEYLPMITKGQKPKKFFIPLSGKTIDIPYLISLGHQVFAIEFLPETIEEWNVEHSLGLKHDKATSIFSTDDGQLTVFSGDFQNCPIENWGPFDVIWDRAAFIALDYSLRSQYAELLKRSVQADSQNEHEFQFLLQTVEYDKKLYGGPPQCVTDDDIKKYFSSWASVKLLEKKLMPEDHPCRNVNGTIAGDPYESFHLLQVKH